MRRRQQSKTLVVLTVIISLALTGIGGVFVSNTVAKEIGPNEVQGKVLAIQTNALHRGTIVVKSDRTGATYTFYVGSSTAYYPRRYPSIGETIRVLYINDRGYLKATRVEIVTK